MIKTRNHKGKIFAANNKELKLRSLPVQLDEVKTTTRALIFLRIPQTASIEYKSEIYNRNLEDTRVRKKRRIPNFKEKKKRKREVEENGTVRNRGSGEDERVCDAYKDTCREMRGLWVPNQILQLDQRIVWQTQPSLCTKTLSQRKFIHYFNDEKI